MNEHDDNENPQAPAKLAEALRAFQKQRVLVPPQVDEKILAAAREHFQQQQKRKIISFPRWTALAASVALVSGLIYFSQTRNQNYAAEDINRDGAVDILDAFVLAKKIELGETRDADFNRDGTVDSQDAAAIASEVVQLEKGDRS
jgi:hypothetical protein